MDTATYVALSRQSILTKVMDTIANNLANSSTTGFKGEKPLFEEYLANTPAGKPIAYVRDAGRRRDDRQGDLTTTTNPLDVALQGNGYLTVGTQAGTRYTRSGRLQVNASGQLVTAAGDTILDDRGAPITMPTGKRPVIGQDGSISADGQSVGKLGIASFAQTDQLSSEGGGLYNTSATPTPDTTTRVHQGQLEGSNVQPVIELNMMMAMQRSFSSQQQILDDEDTRIKSAIDKLGKVA